MWQLVVSHCNESLQWIPSVGIENVMVYTKCGAAPNRTLPYEWRTGENVGRETETFARHLLEQYDALAPYTVFVQGNLAHGGDVVEQLRALQKRPPSACALLGAPVVRARADGCPNHCGLAIQATCARLATAHTTCRAPFPFAAGGQFVLTRQRARALSRARYAEMLAMMRGEARYKRRAPLYPYVFERLWHKLLCW
jgi:hypothetical protein